MTSLSDYYKRLQAHDWTYEDSDDQGVYRKGRTERRILLSIANESQEHQDLFRKYLIYKISGGPKPQEPMEKTFRTGESQ
jgi:hypothetical protein